MLKSTDMIKVTNRSNGIVIYKIPDANNLNREFSPRESKMIPYSEILQVSQQPGGRELLYNFLYFENREVLTNGLNITPEREYNLTEKDLPNWINSCSLDEFKDALDFAPAGIKDLIKSLSVSLPLTDTRKIDALQEQLGFNCAQAIKNEKDTIEDDDIASSGAKQRRVKDVVEEKPPVSKYRRVIKED